MPTYNNGSITRRRALGALGVAGIGSLTGCFGGGGSGGDESEIEIWTVIHGQSDIAATFMEETIGRFEEETDYTVNWVQENVQNVQNGNWRQRMEQGNVPQLFNTAASRTGGFVDAGFVTPWGDVLDEMDSEVVSGTEWAHDVVSNIYRGFDGETRKIMPIGFVMQEPFVARVDHFEEAGLDIEEDFPPENYEELLDIATTLQEDGPGDVGFQVHGAPGDLMDEITPTWAHSYGGTDGLYVNESWDDTLLDSDAWKTSLSQNVEIYRELGLSSENSATTSDEDACRLLINGTASMSQVGMLNYGLFENQAPDMLENGTLRYGQSWEGEAGFRGEFNVQSLAMSSQPPDMDDSTWESKREGAIQFLNMMMSVETQQQVFDSFGLLPFNQDAWDELESRESQVVETGIAVAEGSEYGWQAHPDMADIQYNISGPIFQQAMNGELTPEEACDQAAERIREQVFN